MIVPYYRVEIHIHERSKRTGAKRWKGSYTVFLKDMSELPPYLRQLRYQYKDQPWKYELTYRNLGVEQRTVMENAGRPNNPANDCPECNFLRIQSGVLCKDHRSCD